jgi:hypothetical protein
LGTQFACWVCSSLAATNSEHGSVHTRPVCHSQAHAPCHPLQHDHLHMKEAHYAYSILITICLNYTPAGAKELWAASSPWLALRLWHSHPSCLAGMSNGPRHAPLAQQLVSSVQVRLEQCCTCLLPNRASPDLPPVTCSGGSCYANSCPLNLTRQHVAHLL